MSEERIISLEEKLKKAGEVIAKLKKCIVINNRDLTIAVDVIEVMQDSMVNFMADVCEKTGLDINEYLDLSGEDDGLHPAEASVELYLEEDLPSVYTEDEIMKDLFAADEDDDDETIF